MIAFFMIPRDVAAQLVLGTGSLKAFRLLRMNEQARATTRCANASRSEEHVRHG